MIVDLPDTTASRVQRALVKIRAEGGAVALGRVLTLVIATRLGAEEEAIEAANDASREHPMRVIVVSRPDTTDGEPRLDAQIRVGGDAGASEVVVLKAFGEAGADEEGLITGMLLPDAPVVAWWPGEAPDRVSDSPIGRIAQRRITDASTQDDPQAALLHLARTYRPGDSDFAWTRLTLWRAILAAVLDQPPFETVEAVEVSGAADSPSTELLGAWLGLQLARAGDDRAVGPVDRLERHPRGSARPRGRRHRPGAHRAEHRHAPAARPADTSGLLAQAQSARLPGGGAAPPRPGRPVRPGAHRGPPGTRRAGGDRNWRTVTNERRVLVHPDVDALTAAVAARFLTKLVDLMDEFDTVNVVLTGGTVGAGTQRAVATSGMRTTIDWAACTSGGVTSASSRSRTPSATRCRPARPSSTTSASPSRTSTRSRPPTRSRTSSGPPPPTPRCCRSTPPTAARCPASTSPSSGSAPTATSPRCSRSGSARGTTSTTVIPVRNAPKPPPDRLSLTLPAINTSHRVWMVAAGAEKATALGLALAGASEDEVPVAGVQGRKRTVFFVDEAAAENVPQNLIAQSY